MKFSKNRADFENFKNFLKLCNFYLLNKKHLKNVGPIRHCEPPHTACSNFTLPFTRCRYCRTPPLSHAACESMSTTTSTTTTTTTTTRDRGDRYGPIEWAQKFIPIHLAQYVLAPSKRPSFRRCLGELPLRHASPSSPPASTNILKDVRNTFFYQR